MPVRINDYQYEVQVLLQPQPPPQVLPQPPSHNPQADNISARLIAHIIILIFFMTTFSLYSLFINKHTRQLLGHNNDGNMDDNNHHPHKQRILIVRLQQLIRTKFY